MLTILIFFFSLIPTSALAVQNRDPHPDEGKWLYVGTSVNKEDYYYMREASYGDIVQMWYFSRKPSDAEVIIFLMRYDCESGAERLVRANTYHGPQLAHTSNHEKSEWSHARPGSMAEALLNAACGRRKREWTYVAESEDDVAYFLKLNALGRRGNVVRVWAKTVKNNKRRSVYLAEYDCIEGRTRTIQVTTYDADGTSDTSSRPSNWRYIVPDSVGESVLKRACKKTGSRSTK